MTLDPDTVRLGYRLILDRSPSEAEIDSGCSTFETLQDMRQAFLKSREFRRKFTRITSAADDMQTPALVHLIVPGSSGSALRDRLVALGGLQPALELDDSRRDALRQLPTAEQRGLRYVHGDLGYGTGLGLERPHRYVMMLSDPGPRIHALWRARDPERGFGAFLEIALDDPVLRPEIDNGQIRRLAGQRTLEGIGDERRLLRDALHHAMGDDMIIGFDDAPAALVTALGETGLLGGGTPPVPEPRVPHADYARDVAALSARQKDFLEGYTVWDGYCYTVCRQILLSNPH